MKVVVFLQNPWSPVYAGKKWPRESWLRAFHASRSGQRLRVLVEAAKEGIEFWFDNSNPVVGSFPSATFSPDLKHMQRVLLQQKPDVVITCGQLAEEVIDNVWHGPLIAVPHPASRVLTNELYRNAGWLLIGGDFDKRLAIRQGRGYVTYVPKEVQ